MSDAIFLFIIIPIVLIYTFLHCFEIFRGIYNCVNKNRHFEENIQRETQVSEVLVSEQQHSRLESLTPVSATSDLVTLSPQSPPSSKAQLSSSILMANMTTIPTNAAHKSSAAEVKKVENKA